MISFTSHFVTPGAWDLVKWSKATFRNTNVNLRSIKAEYGLAILVSPDYEVSANKKLLDQMKPRLTVAIVSDWVLSVLIRCPRSRSAPH